MSFRQFGGLNFAAKHNAVSSNYNTSNNFQVTQNVGQTSSYINFLSDISGNLSIYGNVTISGTETVEGLISAPAGITGATGSFNYLYSANTVTASDYRIKENVTQLNDTFVVDELIPVTYTNKITERQDIGLIAHELQEVYPFLVTGEKDGSEYQSVNYTGLIGILVNEIQILKKEIQILKKEMQILKNHFK